MKIKSHVPHVLVVKSIFVFGLYFVDFLKAFDTTIIVRLNQYIVINESIKVPINEYFYFVTVATIYPSNL